MLEKGYSWTHWLTGGNHITHSLAQWLLNVLPFSVFSQWHSPGIMHSEICLNQWLETGLITDPTMNTISTRHMEWALVDNYILIKQERGCFQTSIINPCILRSLNFTSESQFLAFNTSTNKLLHFLIKTNFCFHYSNWFFDWLKYW